MDFNSVKSIETLFPVGEKMEFITGFMNKTKSKNYQKPSNT